MGLRFLFMDDIAAFHCIVDMAELLQNGDIFRATKHVLVTIEKRLLVSYRPPATIWELRLAIQQ